MNQKQRAKFWKGAVEITDHNSNKHRRFDEWFYIETDTGYRAIDEVDLPSALAFFHELADGENSAVYLFRGKEHIATSNGLQSEPYGEIYYSVTKSALPEWLAALTGS